MEKRALLAGPTGLIGKYVLEMLLKDPAYHQVIALTRSPLDIQHPKLRSVPATYHNLSESLAGLSAHDVFCCLGTTMKKAGTKEAFKKVDHDYVIQLARWGKENGVGTFLVVSALGADKSSSIYYNKVKGEMEEQLKEAGYASLLIFRPSLLLGPRSEQRFGEDMAKNFYRLFGFLIPARYKAIEAKTVAAAMVRSALEATPGAHVFESMEIQKKGG